MRALDEYVVHGVQTNIALHKRILHHPRFVSGDIDTGFIDDYSSDLLEPGEGTVPDEAFIAAALYGEVRDVPGARGGSRPAAQSSVWTRVGRWEIGGGK